MWSGWLKKITLLSVLAIFPASVQAIEIHKLDSRDESDLWFRLDKLHEAEDMLVHGEINKARMLLEGLLEQFPDYKEARDLYDGLNDKNKSDAGKYAQAKRRKAEVANVHWLEYLKFKERGQLAGARDRLLSIKGLYSGKGIRPAFLADLDREAEEIEVKIETLLGDRFRQIENGLSKITENEGSQERLSLLVAWYGQLKQILSEYKDFPRATSLKVEVLKELDKAARVLFAKANILKELEGCELAVGKFKALVDILTYPELNFYKRTYEDLEDCED